MLAALPWHSTDTKLRARGRMSLPEMGFQLLFLAGGAGRPSCAFSKFAIGVLGALQLEASFLLEPLAQTKQVV